jgi:hypothetical protein
MGRTWIRIGLIAVVAAVVGVAAYWWGVRDNSGRQAAPRSSTAAVSGSTLKALTAALGRPIYWAGPRHGVTYEFTETADRRVYVRYLPSGVKAGSPRAYFTVATYPIANAYAATVGAAGKAGAVKLTTKNGAVAFYAKARPTNVYLAFPGADVQIEVFDPSGRALRELVAAGRITTVNPSVQQTTAAQTRPARTTPGGLKKLAAQLGHPVYWLGPQPGTTLELSRTPDGRVYIRYLSKGVAPGSKKPFLSVGTYPMRRAATATKVEANKAGAVKIRLPRGAVAFYTKARPTNVYVAFPGRGEQIEVYDPATSNGAQKLVAAGKVAAIS